MGLAKLNVWISGPNDPCSVDNRTWYVTIYDCDGRPLRWCNRRYYLLPAKCGHLEVDVPPGCYRIAAVSSFYFVHGSYWSNWWTDSVVVQACCDEHVCVKLFNPNIHRCAQVFLGAVRGALDAKQIKPELFREIEGGIRKLLEIAPRPAKPFEVADLDDVAQQLKKLEKEAGGNADPAT